LNAPCWEKVYTVCGAEFGEHSRIIGVIKLALYGLKSSGLAWRSHLAETLRSLDFSMCYTENEMWFKPATKLDGTEYYQYVLVYTDDILAISTKPGDILAYFDQHNVLKPNLIGPATQYVGAQIGQYMILEKYVKETIRNVQNWLEQNGLP
jgi:hypothetical protein